MKLVGLLIGSVFGAALWLSGMADYDVIHRGLLFQEAHLYLMMGASIGTAAPLLWLLERRGWRTPLGGKLKIGREAPRAKHVKGGFTFGVGWAIAGTCPGAVAAMVVGGRLNGLWVMLGIAAGVMLRDRGEKRIPSEAEDQLRRPPRRVPVGAEPVDTPSSRREHGWFNARDPYQDW